MASGLNAIDPTSKYVFDAKQRRYIIMTRKALIHVWVLNRYNSKGTHMASLVPLVVPPSMAE
jgi:uncharacterized protein YhbP (UPF0306 family)